jgi:hypothetical protein
VLQSELKRVTDEAERTIADLEERMADSDRKARSAEEYLGKREELMQEKAALQQEMQDMRAQFEQQISEIERQHVQDRWASGIIVGHGMLVRSSLNGGAHTHTGNRGHCATHTEASGATIVGHGVVVKTAAQAANMHAHCPPSTRFCGISEAN